MMSSMKDEDYPALTKKNNDNGYHNHTFLPADMAGPINCLWECKEETSPEDFQTFIDGPDGPGPGIFVNKCYKVMPGGITPTPWDFTTPPTEAPKPTTGSFFWVFHEFKEGAAKGFWDMMGAMKAEDLAALEAKNNSLGFHNPQFNPCGPEGPCICIWETKTAMEIAEFQAFIYGPDGPGAGKVFNNTVYKSMPAGVVPSAKFSK